MAAPAKMAGASRHWAQIDEVSFVGGMRLLFWLGRVFGRWPFRAVLYPVMLWYVVAKPWARAASKDFLCRMAKLDGTTGIDAGVTGVLRHFASFGECILDKLLLWCGLFDTGSVELHGVEQIAGQIAAKRGALLICCHLGNLELCRVMSKRQPGLKLTVLQHTKHATRFNQLLAKVNPDSQLNLMQVTDLTPATAALLKEKIDQGEFVAIVGDRIPVAPEPRVALAPFLGAMAPFPVGPYLMASLFQCPVYLLFSLRTRRGWEIHFESFRESIYLPRQDRTAVLAALAGAYAARLEHYCRQAPLQWFNFYDFWQVGRLNHDHAAR
ncbi:MAG: acyltransferase [Candidatus Binatia bacterium]